jgi:hypothetical protein
MASRRGSGIGSLCVELLGLSNSGVDNNLSTFFEWRLSTCDSNSLCVSNRERQSN